MEEEKGKWTFHDADIARFRAGHIKIFAQLGTAPAWATHYGDLGCKNMGYFENQKAQFKFLIQTRTYTMWSKFQPMPQVVLVKRMLMQKKLV